MAKFRFLGIRRVKVAGESMSPTYDNGDVLLVRWFDAIPAELPLTTVVVIEREEMPGIFFIKRIQKSDRKSTRLNSSHVSESRMPSSA